MDEKKLPPAATPLDSATDTPPESATGPEQANAPATQTANQLEDDTASEEILKIHPVRNTVLFPHNVLPLTSGKEWSAPTVERALRQGGRIGILAQRDATVEDPSSQDDLYAVGTEARVVKIVRFPDQSMGAVVQGLRRFRIEKILEKTGSSFVARVKYLEDAPLEEDLESVALGRGLKQLIGKAIQLSPNIPGEAALFVENVQDPIYLAYLVVPYLSIDFAARQALLEIDDIDKRLRRVHYYLARELEILEISQKIHTEVHSEVGKQQRKYYVREQLKMLQKELGELDGKKPGSADEPEDFKSRIEKSAMPAEAREAANREVDRLSMMQAGSPEYMVSFTYANWLLDIPWGVATQERIDLKAAKKVLDDDHYGLQKIKKRVLEFLAVYALKKTLKGPILLLVGPPGVGKTSLGKSVAKALGRKFVRIALGGVRDEAEIRGHRRTYIGSMPGKFVDALKKAGSMDPVILLDEVDKISADQRGDPASALLEVLDSEQNHTFTDHYLNVPVDLSKVLFIATANSAHAIPGPLLDRMEVLELSGYTPDEKIHIASEHLLPQVIEEHGLAEFVDLQIPPGSLKEIIQNYTREAGVRQLRRELASVARSVAHEIVELRLESEKSQPKAKSARAQRVVGEKPVVRKVVARKTIDQKFLKTALGPVPFPDSERPSSLPVGVATGLAYTPVGGDVLYIETALSKPGTGKLSLTGQLGDVMKESVQTALAYLRANPAQSKIKNEALGKTDLHVHFPAGAVRKDGPSAGVAVFVAMASQFSGRQIAAKLAMTGEISLRGELLPVGGIKEKLLAAHRYGMTQVIIPAQNERDLAELPDTVRKEMSILPLSTLDEVLKVAFPAARPSKMAAPQKLKSAKKRRAK